MRRLAIALLAVLACSASAFAQGATYYGKERTPVGGGVRFPLVYVCNSSASLTVLPCPAGSRVTIYTSDALSVQKDNPFRGDADGNYQFSVAPGTYTVSIGDPLVPGYSFRVVVGAGGSGGASDFSELSGSAACSQLPALIGEATTNAGSCTTVVAAAGNDQEVQVNSSGVRAGDSQFLWDSMNHFGTIGPPPSSLSPALESFATSETGGLIINRAGTGSWDDQALYIAATDTNGLFAISEFANTSSPIDNAHGVIGRAQLYGTTTSESADSIVGVQGISYVSSGGNVDKNMDSTIAGLFGITQLISSSANHLSGASVQTRSDGSTVEEFTDFEVNSSNINNSTITNLYGIKLVNPVFTGSNTITNHYGAYVPTLTEGSGIIAAYYSGDQGSNYSYYAAGGLGYHAGAFEFGTSPTVPADPYDSGWNGDLSVPTKDDVYDKIEALVAGGGLGDAQTSDPLDQFAATTSAELASVLTDESGTGVVAYTISPVFTTPNIGSATGSISGNAGTATALAANGTNCGVGEYARGVDASGNAEDCTAGAGDALTTDPLSQFAATTSAELAGVLSDENGSGGGFVRATSPTLTTPTLGVATATSINKVAITAPASAATLTIANNKTLTVSNTLTLTGTDSSTVAFGAGGTVTYEIAAGTADLGTSAIASEACDTVVTVSATGVASTDTLKASFNADPTGVTGYVPSVDGMLTIFAYPTADNVNFKVCNFTANSVTPGAVTLNWRVDR